MSRQTISQHKKRLGADAPDLTDRKAWATILAATGEEGTGPPDLRRRMAEERLRLLGASANREQLRLKRESEDSWDANDVGMAIKKSVSAFWFAYDRMAQVEMPPLIKGQTESGARDLLVEAGKKLKAVLMQELKQFSGEDDKP